MKCKECNNTLKQVGNTKGYYCDSAPTRCSMSLKIHYIQYHTFTKFVTHKNKGLRHIIIGRSH